MEIVELNIDTDIFSSPPTLGGAEPHQVSFCNGGNRVAMMADATWRRQAHCMRVSGGVYGADDGSIGDDKGISGEGARYDVHLPAACHPCPAGLPTRSPQLLCWQSQPVGADCACIWLR